MGRILLLRICRIVSLFMFIRNCEAASITVGVHSIQRQFTQFTTYNWCNVQVPMFFPCTWTAISWQSVWVQTSLTSSERTIDQRVSCHLSPAEPQHRRFSQVRYSTALFNDPMRDVIDELFAAFNGVRHLSRCCSQPKLSFCCSGYTSAFFLTLSNRFMFCIKRRVPK